MPPTIAPLRPFRVDGGMPGVRYLVDPACSAGRFGRLQAHPATDGAGCADLIALVVPRPRRAVLARLRGHWIPGLTTPLADSASPIGHIALCRRPRRAVALEIVRAARRGWTEAALFYTVLRPVARCLAELHRMGIAHGSVEPGNLFATAEGSVVLGPFWSAPDPGAAHRAEASPADDVRALGLTLLALFLGQDEPPGDASALDDAVLPAALARLLRQMLDADRSERPDAAALTDPCGLLNIALPPVDCMPGFLAGHPPMDASALRR